MNKIKKLTLSKYTYGVNKSPVITLKYSDTEEVINYYPKDNQVSIDIIEKIGSAMGEGYLLIYTDAPTKEDVRPIYELE